MISPISKTRLNAFPVKQPDRGVGAPRMDPCEAIEFDICALSAWAPGLEDMPSWHLWADGTKEIAGPVTPDVQFVAPMLRRRLSSLSRMVFRVATDCLEGQAAPQAYVFCSRYGEYGTSFDILMNLAKGGDVSPAAFSTSVHNTSSSQFSIARQDRSQTTMLTAGEATLEAAFVEAWGLLCAGNVSRVLVVYHDEVLPPLYEKQATTVRHSAAFAFLLGLPVGTATVDRLNLSWRPQTEAPGELSSAQGNDEDAALRVLRLVLKGGDQVIRDTGRLEWIWSKHAAAN
jgi:hypothetical protein